MDRRLKRNILVLGGISALAVGVLIVAFPSSGYPDGSLDGFARCLGERGAVMYGAAWCPHCLNEKRGFGTSFRLIAYVECPKDPQRCLASGITGYPTWVFADGRRFEGEQGLPGLAAASGCPLPSGAEN